MRRSIVFTLIALFLSPVLMGCTIEKDTSEAVNIPEDDPVIRIETDDRPSVDVDINEEGPFERLGATMDKGARRLDEKLEKGAGKLGEAMQEAGRDLQEKSERAQAERRGAPSIEVDVDVQR